MPEAAVNKHHNTLSPEGEIRAAGQRQMTAPTLDAMLSKEPYQAQFR